MTAERRGSLVVTDHEERVRDIIVHLKELAELRRPARIHKSDVSHFVPNPHDRDTLPRIDISRLNRILSIDAERRLCVAEPGVTFSRLVTETLRHGFVPSVVPELKNITIGGAVSGCSVESTSHRYGGFHDSCLEYEILTGDGRLLTCSRERDAEVFEMMHGSFGTLGIITKITLRLLPARPCVKMTYEKHACLEGFYGSMREHIERADHIFIDGIIHGRKELVLCLGDMTDSSPYVSSYDWLRIYYQSTASRREDYLSTYDYFFRYDTECHWLTKTIPLMENPLVRLVFGKWLLGSKNLIKRTRPLRIILDRVTRRPRVVVDVFIPEDRFEAFFRWYETEFDFYPVWIVPYRMPRLYPWVNRDYAKGISGTLVIDCAIYGKQNGSPDVDYSELLEKKVIELNGIKTLISRNHYDRETFWRIYDRQRYEAVKSRTDPHALFMDIYDKMVGRFAGGADGGMRCRTDRKPSPG